MRPLIGKSEGARAPFALVVPRSMPVHPSVYLARALNSKTEPQKTNIGVNVRRA